MKINAWAMTDKGLRRSSNQDSFLVNLDDQIFIVADGMGGHSGGEVASFIAVTESEKKIKENRNRSASYVDLICESYLHASQKIFDIAAHEKPELSGMGTTMVMGVVLGDEFFIGNVGDSRCYLHADQNIWQLTEDHSLVNEHIRSGTMSEEQARAMVQKNVITRSVGFDRDVVPDIIRRKLTSGDKYLFCSDGLSGLVSDQKIGEILNENSPEDAIKLCIELALANGGDDNVTVLIVEVV